VPNSSVPLLSKTEGSSHCDWRFQRIWVLRRALSDPAALGTRRDILVFRISSVSFVLTPNAQKLSKLRLTFTDIICSIMPASSTAGRGMRKLANLAPLVLLFATQQSAPSASSVRYHYSHHCRPSANLHNHRMALFASSSTTSLKTSPSCSQ